MTDIGQKERQTQNRVVKLLRDQLGYTYGGSLEAHANSNIDEARLLAFLTGKQGHPANVAERAVLALQQTASDTTKTLYDRNRATYQLLRYGVKIKAEHGEQTTTVHLIDWDYPENNDFVASEEVTVVGKSGPGSTKRPDVVLYVNGIALAVIELKRSTVSLSEGIRQNLDNQRPEFIEHFFSTVQWVMAGNDTQGLRYGTIQTPETFYMAWKEDGPENNLLDRSVRQVCEKARLLELIHDFVVFDAGVKKLCRHNQYFGVRAAQLHAQDREGGIIWHTQGSGKSLTMVWLARWIREHIEGSRVLIITDRTELDDQIESVFKDVGETIHRTTSGEDLVDTLNAANPWLICSLIHKFAKRSSDEDSDVPAYLEAIRSALPTDFKAKGELFVFVDECHRSQSNLLHEAMKELLPDATFIGFTGTPLLKSDKARSIEVFGPYIHTYKFDEAVRDGVVVDLRYEARDIDQRLTSQAKVDQWFAAKTKDLNDVAKAQLKQKWGTMQQVLSSRSRLNQIVADIVLDMETRDRLMSGRGNAILVSSSIFEACVFYDLFQKTQLKGKCGIITSYTPTLADLKGESTGEGETLPEQQFNIYRQMLADWFHVDIEHALAKAKDYETAAKERFVKQPGQMKLLVVVDKLLTGFDAPSATYLYIDKQMRDHGLFQAICRVNRLDGDDKEYGYVVDYKDLFKSLEGAVQAYTSEVLDDYDKDDVAGLLKNRISEARDQLDDALEAVRALVEPVAPPRDSSAYLHYFCGPLLGDAAQLKENEPKRLALYKQVGHLVRALANMAGDHQAAGYSDTEFEKIRAEVGTYESVRAEVKLASGDYIDLKAYEPAMRHLIDTYIKAEDSTQLSTFDDMSFIQLLVDRGAGAIDDLPSGLQSEDTAAETITNNVRRLIIDEQPVNPKYYEKMSALLDALIERRRQQSIDYQTYLAEMIELAKKASDPSLGSDYPSIINTPGRRAIYDFLFEDEGLAIEVDGVARGAQDGWRGHTFRTRKLRNELAQVLGESEVVVEELLGLVKAHAEY